MSQLHTPRPTFTPPHTRPASPSHRGSTQPLPAVHSPRQPPGPAHCPPGRPPSDQVRARTWPPARPVRPGPPPSPRVPSLRPAGSLARSLARSLPIWEGGCGAGGGGRRRGGAGRVTCERRAGGRWKGERHGASNKRVGVGKSRPSLRGSGRSVRAPAAPRLRASAPDPGAVLVRSLAPAACARLGPPRWPRVRAMRR